MDSSIFKIPIISALVSLSLAVILGAFGAHIFEDRFSAHYFGIYETASFYHFIHSLGWLLACVLGISLKWSSAKWIHLFFGLGLSLFCGSLYVLSFNEYLDMPQLRKLGAITPIGGICFVLAWGCTAWKVVRHSH